MGVVHEPVEDGVGEGRVRDTEQQAQAVCHLGARGPRCRLKSCAAYGSDDTIVKLQQTR